MFRHVAQQTFSRSSRKRTLQSLHLRSTASLAHETTQQSVYIQNANNLPYPHVDDNFIENQEIFSPGKIGVGSLSVATTSRAQVPVDIDHPLSIPLTLVDVHCRDEQLPFAYFFDASLPRDDLVSSLKRVLKSFPMLGGTIDWTDLTIRVTPNEGSVNISFGESTGTAEQWAKTGRHGLGNGRSPSIMGLFDPLESEVGVPPPLATVRITYLGCGGTAIGINLSHALADASSCFRFVQCWGREMSGLRYPTPCAVGMNERASATTAGMTTRLHAELLNLSPPSKLEGESMFDTIRKMANTIIPDWVHASNPNSDARSEKKDNGSHPLLTEEKEVEPSSMESTDSIPHEYVSLQFSPDVLRAMKAYGMTYLAETRNSNSQQVPVASASCESPKFVSTNDMIVALGWLMQRQVSGRDDWQMSIVMNLRGRGGVNDFIPFDQAENNDCEETISPFCSGVFGNGIMNVVATLPPTSTAAHVSSLDTVTKAAIAIRSSVTKGLQDIPDKVASSKLGIPVASSIPAGTNCFCTTSWQSFPLWDLSFTKDGNQMNGGSLVGFHGQPAHPLPPGKNTYAGVVVPTKDGGCVYQLLAPSGQRAEEAKLFHQKSCEEFLKWYDDLKQQ